MTIQSPISDIQQRFAVTEEILGKIAERFKDGQGTADLLETLQSLWSGIPAGIKLTPAEQTRLTDLLQKLNETIDVGENWMDQTAAILDHMGRGNRMLREYQT
jgi:hypothetical protein